MKKYSLFFMLIFSLFNACKKHDVEPVVPTRTELLVSNKWREIGHSVNGISVGSGPGGNIYDLAPACERDNFIQFNADYTFTVDEGTTKCTASAPQTRMDRWSFRPGDETQLVIALPDESFSRGQAYIFDITTLSANTLALKYVNYGLQGPQVEEITYVAF